MHWNPLDHRFSGRGDIAALVALLLLFYLTARIGNEVEGLRGAQSLVWPASAIGLAIVLRYGYRTWPAILAVAVAAVWPALADVAGPFWVTLSSALLIGFAATLEALLVGWGVRRLTGDAYLKQAPMFLLGTLVALPIGTFVATVPQLFGSWLGGLTELSPPTLLGDILLVGHAIWIADVVGMVALTPPILLWLGHPRSRLSLPRGAELFGYGIVVGFVLVFRGAVEVTYLLFVVHMIIAVRVPLHWASLAALATSTVLVVQAAAAMEIPDPRTLYEIFLADLSLVLILNLVTYATALFWKESLAARRSLEEQVSERTEELETANARLQTLSHTDALTGAWNRRYFDAVGRRALERALKDESVVAVLAIDFDHFKRVNDTHGHAVGDRVLIAAVDRMAGQLRPTDVLARIGGEEFAVLLPECDPDHVLDVAERLRAAMAAAPFRARTHTTVPVTISIGVALKCPEPTEGMAPEEHLEALLRTADRRLYRAKAAGRNRVVAGRDG